MEEKHNCRYLVEELSDYVDGALSADICTEIERHLAGCENCRIVVDTLRKTVYLVHATAESEPVPADVRERLYKCLNLREFLSKDT